MSRKEANLVVLLLVGIVAVGVSCIATRESRISTKPADFGASPIAGVREQKSETSSIVKVKETSPAVSLMLRSASKRPSPKELYDLQPTDRAAALDRYRSEKNLTNKFSLTWALTAFEGDDEIANALIDTVLLNHNGQTWPIEGFDCMLETLLALGMVAAKSDVAFAFLRQAATQEFWELHRKWKISDPGMERGDGGEAVGVPISCTKYAIKGLGLSRRPEVRLFLEGLRTLYPMGTERLSNIAGAIASALYEMDRTEEKGAFYYRDLYLTRSVMRDFETWSRTPKGAELQEWSKRTTVITDKPSIK